MTLDYSNSQLILLLAGPSGAGKNTLIKSLLEKVQNIYQLPSVTTRSRRPGEEENIHHLFVSEQEFARLISNDEFIEWKISYGHYYGTLKTAITTALTSVHDHIGDVDIWGAVKIKANYSRNVVIVFIKTSSLDVLEQRLRQRGMLTDQEIADRLATARRELEESWQSDHIISNDDLEETIVRLADIVTLERKRLTTHI